MAVRHCPQREQNSIPSSGQPPAPQAPAPAVQSNPRGFNLRETLGDRPCLSEYLRPEAIDAKNHRLFMYGGEPPGSDYGALHQLDTRTMTMTDLSGELRFRDPSWSMFAKSIPKRLPILDMPAMTFIEIERRNLVVLWGGTPRDPTGDFLNPTTDLILIDVDSRLWCKEHVEGTAPKPRMLAAIIAVEHQIFIFGGFSKYPQYEESAYTSLRTYTILQFVHETKSWNWAVTDKKYPPHICAGAVNPNFESAVPMNNGLDILLTPARTSLINGSVNIGTKAMCIFNIEHQLFQPLTALAGDLPPDLKFYAVWPFVPTPDVPDLGILQPRSPVRHSTGSATKYHPYLVPNRQASSLRSENQHSVPECHIICGWPKGQENISLGPKFWKLIPSRSSCYLMSFVNTPELKSGDQEPEVRYYHFVVVGRQAFLLGSRNSPVRPRILDLVMEIPSNVFS